MATPEADVSPAIPVHMVASAFVKQYYKVLYDNPEIAYKFYEDSSTITRPNLIDEEMSSVSTMLGIKDKILSSEYYTCKAEISSVDAQESCNKAIMVLVTGFLIGEGELKRSFIQTFLLAKHAKGYFVLNDILKFGVVMDETVVTASDNAVTETDATTPSTEGNQESAQVIDQQAEVKQPVSVPEKVNSNGPVNPSLPIKGSEDKDPILKPVVVSKQEITSSQKQKQKQTLEPPKISYASMVAKVSPVTTPVKRLANQVVVVAPSANSSFDQKIASPQQVPPPRRTNTSQIGDSFIDGKSVYVGNLPPRISAEQLEKSFSEYGSVRKDGIQIRTYDDGFCYGFVEFETSEAARKAIEKHVHLFGKYNSYITEKRSSVQGNNRVRQGSGKGEPRSMENNRRSRENSVEGGRDGWVQNGQNRGAHNNRNRYDSQFQNRGPSEYQNRWRNGSGEQRAYQNGDGRLSPTKNMK